MTEKVPKRAPSPAKNEVFDENLKNGQLMVFLVFIATVQLHLILITIIFFVLQGFPLYIYI